MKLKKLPSLNTVDKNKHLTEEAVAHYAEAMHSNRMNDIACNAIDHVEHCSRCHSEVVSLYALLQQMEGLSLSNEKNNKPSKTILRRIYRLALVASVAGIVIFLYLNDPKAKNLPPAQIVVQKDDRQTIEPAPPETIKKTPAEKEVSKSTENISPANTPLNKPSTSKDLFASNFVPSEDYEALIGTEMRYGALEILKPRPGSHFKPEEMITFSWDFKNSDLLYITILNNREDKITRQEIIDSTFSTRSIIQPGLYYWTVENEVELLHVGKFYIDK